MKVFNTLLCVVFLLGTTLAQKQPLALSFESGRLTAKNTSDKEVIAFVVQYESTKQATSTLSHDFYFKAHGIAPAEIRAISEDIPIESGDMLQATVLFAQSVDGSIWGDVNADQGILSTRGPMKQFYQAVLSSYEQQGETAFLDRLNRETEFRGPRSSPAASTKTGRHASSR